MPLSAARGCSRCGAPVEPWDRFCNACGAEQPLHARSPAPPETPKYFRCENCGAQVAVDPNQRSYTCAFCDSTYVVEFTPERERQLAGVLVDMRACFFARDVPRSHDNARRCAACGFRTVCTERMD